MFFNIFTENFKKIAHNVKAIRRFCAPNKETVGFQGHKNVPEKNPTKALLRRLGFFVGQAATAAQRIAYVKRSKICYVSRAPWRAHGVLFLTSGEAA
ncbi:hypothetical protein FACS189485_20160 [Spirochaetia bacterium]|nr:hypothetical protein FACS189485_20160 [Spirochaetia bacterium]